MVLSGYHSPAYDPALRGWHRVEIATDTAQGGARAERAELLWANREFRNSEARKDAESDETPAACAGCGRVLVLARTGRPG